MLQCIAWANMIREYSEMVPLSQAVQMTFSGQYPCSICKAIADKKNSEQQQKALALEKHEKKVLPAIVIASFKVTFSTISYPDLVVSFHDHHDSPPSPPPRSALV